MSPSIIATQSVPAELKHEFYVDKIVNIYDHTALRCISEESTNFNPVVFYLYMAGADDKNLESFLHIMTFPANNPDYTDIQARVCNPVYPFNAADMPEKVQGLINMAEQWLIHLDQHSF